MKRSLLCFLAVVVGNQLLLSSTLVAAPKKSTTQEMDNKSQEEWAYSVGIQNYIFGLPLTIFERERKLRMDPAQVAKARAYAPAAPINQIGHLKSLATADDIMPYTPNNDTVYSGALLELSEQPIILTAPDIADRYWSVEFADSYLNNLFYIGTRATGGKGGNHAFVGPNWKGTLPAGLIEHRIPSNSAIFALRIGVLPNDKDDLAIVHSYQSKFALTSLNNWNNPKTFGKADIPKMNKRPAYTGDLAFYQTLSDLISENPPPKEHEAALIVLDQGGVRIGERFDRTKLSVPIQKGLARAAAESQKVMLWKVKYRGQPYPSRWNNLRPGDYGFDYLNRAAGALEGLFVHNREEAVYFSTYEDGDGNLLNGQHNYVLHFKQDEIPPTLKYGFWSITMYGADFQLVKNSISRYSIGDRTKGLRFNQDKSLDIFIGARAPVGKESNWLPSPQSGQFRLNYRIYLPTEVAQNPKTLSKFIPPVKKVAVEKINVSAKEP
ncbi:hypothetical protein D3C87_952670 [compost metagenome]